MRINRLAALVALLIGYGMACAQQPGTLFAEPSLQLTAEWPCTCCDPESGVSGFWGSSEYLLWWLKGGRVPPLATAGGNGVPGSPGTRIVLDNLDFVDAFRQGGRFAIGYQFESFSAVGMEMNYFCLADGQAAVRLASNGDPVIGRPYINLATGLPAATLISLPEVASGSVTFEGRTRLTGAEANLAAEVFCSDRIRVTLLGGFRYLALDDQLKVDEQFLFAGNAVALQDDFRTFNRFYGGQLGIKANTQRGPWSLDFQTKLGLGQMQQITDIDGVTRAVAPSGSVAVFEGGLFALRSNIGRHQRELLAFVPELNLNVGYQLTRHLKLYAGYSIFWVSTAARAGEQIDPVVNQSQFPILSGNGPLVGPARPAFNFTGNDFWAQGVTLGLELRY